MQNVSRSKTFSKFFLIVYGNGFSVLISHTFWDSTALESGRNIGQGLIVCMAWIYLSKITNVGPWINIGHEQNVQSYVETNFEVSESHVKNSKIW